MTRIDGTLNEGYGLVVILSSFEGERGRLLASAWVPGAEYWSGNTEILTLAWPQVGVKQFGADGTEIRELHLSAQSYAEEVAHLEGHGPKDPDGRCGMCELEERRALWTIEDGRLVRTERYRKRIEAALTPREERDDSGG